jgi:hypothetical protein
MSLIQNNLFENIDYELIISNIVPYLKMKEVLMFVLCSKKYLEFQNDAFIVHVKNNMFLNHYLSVRKLDFIPIVEKSSFKKCQFLTIFDNISHEDKIFDESILKIDLSKNISFHKNQTTIDSTFELFKILMCLTMFHMKKQYKNMITLNMLDYFQDIYNIKNNEIFDKSHDIFLKFIRNRDIVLWFSSNINLYNIYETINLINDDNGLLKKTIRSFEPNNIIAVDYNHMNTISVLMFIFNNLDSIECKIYICSYILKYKNMMILNCQNMVDVDYLYETSAKLNFFKNETIKHLSNQLYCYK